MYKIFSRMNIDNSSTHNWTQLKERKERVHASYSIVTLNGGVGYFILELGDVSY